MTLTAKDNKGLESVGFFKVTVENVNRSPVTLSPSINTSIIGSFLLTSIWEVFSLTLTEMIFNSNYRGSGAYQQIVTFTLPGLMTAVKDSHSHSHRLLMAQSQSLPIRIEVRNLNRPPDVFARLHRGGWKGVLFVPSGIRN